MEVKEDNGVDAETYLFISQVYTLMWLLSLNKPIRLVRMQRDGGRWRRPATVNKVSRQSISGIPHIGLLGMLSCVDTRSGTAEKSL